MTVKNYDVFISYCHKDKSEVNRSIVGPLQESGLSVWIDESRGALDQALSFQLEAALNQSTCLLAVLSLNAATSDWVAREVAYWNQTKERKAVIVAIDDIGLKGKPSIPILFQNQILLRATEPSWVPRIAQMTARAAPLSLFDYHVERTSLFEPLLELARRRDVLFLIGGVGSGVRTLRDRIVTYIKRESTQYTHFSTEYNFSNYFTILEWAKKRNMLLQATGVLPLEAVHLPLKVLLASLAYSIFSALYQHSADELGDLMSPAVATHPILFAERYYFSDRAMQTGDYRLILEHFFSTLQTFAEKALGDARILVLMPWRELSRCVHRPGNESELLLREQLWKALIEYAKVGRSLPARRMSSNHVAESRIYDRVCFVVAGDTVPLTFNPPSQPFLSRTVIPIPPLTATEVRYLLEKVLPTLVPAETTTPIGHWKQLESLEAKLLSWTGGSPWFVQLVLTFLAADPRLRANKPSENPPTEAELHSYLDKALSESKDALTGSRDHLPSKLREHIDGFIAEVLSEFGGPDGLDHTILAAWSEGHLRRSRGCQATERLDAWVASGLVWLAGDRWDPSSKDHVFFDYPEFVYLDPAAELPFALYKSICQQTPVQSSGIGK